MSGIIISDIVDVIVWRQVVGVGVAGAEGMSGVSAHKVGIWDVWRKVLRGEGVVLITV